MCNINPTIKKLITKYLKIQIKWAEKYQQSKTDKNIISDLNLQLIALVSGYLISFKFIYFFCPI